MSQIYKVTSATVARTKNGYELFKLQFNNATWATQLMPVRRLDEKYNKLFKLYEEGGFKLDSLVGHYISTHLTQSKYGTEFGTIQSFDVLKDFKKELDESKGVAFSTTLPLYDFLVSKGRDIEEDDSIKLSTQFDDMRISKVKGINLCYQQTDSTKYLDLKNIEQIFTIFYKDVPLPPRGDGENSYYSISYPQVAIVEMYNYVRTSEKMTLKGEVNEWNKIVIQRVGDKLSEEQIKYLKEKN